MLKQDWIKDINSIYSSKEQKSIDGAEIISQFMSLEYKLLEDLGENDRSSTGFLYKDKFDEMVKKFFNNPQISVEGWESASAAAQERIVKTVRKIIKDEKQFPIAIISHGGVSGLLLCYIKIAKYQ